MSDTSYLKVMLLDDANNELIPYIPPATETVAGLIKPDGTTVEVDATGTISLTDAYISSLLTEDLLKQIFPIGYTYFSSINTLSLLMPSTSWHESVQSATYCFGYEYEADGHTKNYESNTTSSMNTGNMPVTIRGNGRALGLMTRDSSNVITWYGLRASGEYIQPSPGYFGDLDARKDALNTVVGSTDAGTRMPANRIVGLSSIASNTGTTCSISFASSYSTTLTYQSCNDLTLYTRIA